MNYIWQFVSELEIKSKRKAPAYTCCKSNNDEQTIKIGSLSGREFQWEKHLRPFPTKGDAHARVTQEILVCINPTITNHCHTDKSILERPDTRWMHTENNSHSDHDPQR